MAEFPSRSEGMDNPCEELTQDIIRTIVLIKFHEECFQQTGTIFELIQDIINPFMPSIHGLKQMLLPSVMMIGQYIFVFLRVLQVVFFTHIRKNAPPPGGLVFQATGNIFELVQDII
ncbi:hypothetical protein DPMN_122330 [Dreissena polymorpha]|uniref:Uncharacterized protein n=1 Tax=Dreissena polymorpha TaxID=45954 RepID=A0A9D4GP69_DREPO|nr:hypothetical protein DPMN_122330 [Dreissena polymorpha]